MSEAHSCRHDLKEMIEKRISADLAGWLNTALASIHCDSVGPVISSTARQVGTRALIGAIGERKDAVVAGVYGPVPIGHWNVDDAVNVLIISAAADETDNPFEALFKIYDNGDTSTRVAALRSVNFVLDSDSSAGLELIYDAGRTYLQELMEAAWCNNPFSNQYLSNTEYRKAFLKALFCDVPVDGFMDLDKRADEQMSESLQDFADEREAAGRVVPDAVWTVAALHPRPGLVARLIGRLEHPTASMRTTAAVALRNASDPRSLSFLRERLERESNPDVQSAIQDAIDVLTRG